ncbi:hypothetical protein [Arsenicicoccus piscis]|uniref:Cyclic nucleotide-binding domain-containing protein n=1 Tax=Arsenicicoccus piscis TaxID=673954 RepID=A0ABQ6HPS1_9MICO|nr:hypothetical protein [Arsenicicoccus piscis]GMA19673.1 hypothetical protein GCM10025862_16940 [Arsenicicoccus piscis]
MLDAFKDASAAVYVVLSGQVGLWHDPARLNEEPDEIVSPEASSASRRC